MRKLEGVFQDLSGPNLALAASGVGPSEWASFAVTRDGVAGADGWRVGSGVGDVPALEDQPACRCQYVGLGVGDPASDPDDAESRDVKSLDEEGGGVGL